MTTVWKTRLVMAGLLFAAAYNLVAAPPPAPIAELNKEFLAHLSAFGQDQVVAVASIRQAWKDVYEKNGGESFVPDALAVLYPAYRAGLDAFDRGESQRVLESMRPLTEDADPYLAANARYFQVRALVDLNRFEEAEKALSEWTDSVEQIAHHTPYAAHLGLIRGFCEYRNLRFDDAARTLALVASRFPGSPEPVEFGVRQLLLEIERRERGNLREVSELMTYVADRLSAADAGQRVRETQDEVLARLDKLIQETQQREQQQKAAAARAQGMKPTGGEPNGKENPREGRETSEAPTGAGDVGELHGSPRAMPGESWGKLPPSERERILQAIRERFPSRYRQIVEQYYRSLAEEK